MNTILRTVSMTLAPHQQRGDRGWVVEVHYDHFQVRGLGAGGGGWRFGTENIPLAPGLKQLR